MSKRILITGASSGFGRDTAETLHRAGHTVYASMREAQGKNREAAEGLRELGIKTVEVDVRDDASVDAGVKKVLAEAGKIDVLVNNAGIGSAGVTEATEALMRPTSLDQQKEDSMEFLVEFEVEVPAGTPDAEVEQRQRAESAAAAELAEDGHLVRLWRRPLGGDGTKAIGLYRADSAAELDDLLGALPFADWLRVMVTPLASHPNDPATASR